MEVAAQAAEARPAQSRIDTATKIPMLGGVRASSPQASAEGGSVAVAEPGLFIGQVDGRLDGQSSGELEGNIDALVEAALESTNVEAQDELQDEAGIQPESAAAPDSLAALRVSICVALEQKEHYTAASLLSAGEWSETTDTIRAAVNVKKTMLSLTMNAEAEKICKGVLAATGSPKRFTVVSADGASTGDLPGKAPSNGNGKPATPTSPGRIARPAAGSIQAEALAHPLVKQAQELFSAEVRHVLDLRKP